MLKRLLLLLPLVAANAGAQETLDEQPAEARRYTVEMIIFAYAEGVSAGTEIFVPDAPLDEELQPVDEFAMESTGTLRSMPQAAADSVVEASRDEVVEPRPKTAVPYDVTMLAEDDFSLVKEHEHLERLGAYEPLLHFGWTQATVPDRVSEPRPLSSFVRPPPGLDGDLNLYLSRYLHLAINLQLDAPSTNAAFSSYNNEFVLGYPVRYRISEDRIFRNGELRYFDHPKFGVLAKISRVEETVEDELGETELLGYDGE